MVCRTKAREELRGLVGNLRFDIGNSSATLDKASKKKAQELTKTFYRQVPPLASSGNSCCRPVFSSLSILIGFFVHSTRGCSDNDTKRLRRYQC